MKKAANSVKYKRKISLICLIESELASLKVFITLTSKYSLGGRIKKFSNSSSFILFKRLLVNK